MKIKLTYVSVKNGLGHIKGEFTDLNNTPRPDREYELKEIKGKQETGVNENRILAAYYSVYFEEPDVNTSSEVKVLKHKNNMAYTRKDLKKYANYFPTREEANQARKQILAALKL